MSTTLIQSPFAQWAHTYVTIASEPNYVVAKCYDQSVAHEAKRRGLYTFPVPPRRTFAQEGWTNFVKGIMTIYTINDFRTACSKAKDVLYHVESFKREMDHWARVEQDRMEQVTKALWCAAQEAADKIYVAAQEAKKAVEDAEAAKEAAPATPVPSLAELRKVLEDAEKKESRTHDTLWFAEANEDESIADYNMMKKELEHKEYTMKNAIENRKNSDKIYVAAQEAVKVAKKAVEDAKAAAKAAAKPSCELPFTDNTFKPLESCKAILNPGTYYIGDPCYPLGDSWIYKKAWDSADYVAPGYFHSDRGCLVVDGTAWGDGSYHEDHEFKDEKNEREYLVDSGTIAIISHTLIVDEVKRLAIEGKPQTFESLVGGGHIHTFKEEVEIDFEDGVFTFNSGWNSFTIDTNGCETCHQETDDEESDDE
jgi:hypothetical protein